MSRSNPFLFIAAFLALAAGPIAQGAAENRPVSNSGASLAIDGAFAGFILQHEGGEPWADVATQSGPSGALGKRHVANLHLSPLVLELSFLPMAPVVAWINDLCAGRPTAKNISVTYYDGSGRPIGSTDYLSSNLTEVRFPALDGLSSASARITLVIAPEQFRTGTVAISGSGGSPGLPVNSFALSIGPSLSGEAVTKIDALIIKSPVVSDSLGASRSPTRTQGPVTASNLVLTILDSRAANWKAWRDSFLIQGQHLEADELDGSITLGGKSNGSTTGVSLTFSHLGIVSLAQIPGATGGVAYDKVELYFEGLTLTGPQAPGKTGTTTLSTQPAANTQPATGSNASAAAASTTTPADSATTPPAPADQGRNTTRMAAIDQAPLASATPAQAAGSSTVRTVDANPPAAGGPDAGPRDPADFPRFAGTVRTVFSANAGKVQADESATYTTSAGFDQVVAFYNGQPKSAGWEEINRSETSRSASDRTMSIEWSKPQKTARVRINLQKNGVTEIWLTVTTVKTAK